MDDGVMIMITRLLRDIIIMTTRPLQMDDGASREGIKDPRELLKATAALSAKGAPAKSAPGVPALALGDENLDEYDELGAAGPGLRRTPTMLARMKKSARYSPRSTK